MDEDKLEGWCQPMKGAEAVFDHTFVYYRDDNDKKNNEVFGCWSSGDPCGENAAQVSSGGQAKNAYRIADCYRKKVEILGKEYPDTAGIGLYGVHGVCHQSANCFLHAVGGMLEMTKGRPRGLVLSVAAYGVYGTYGLFDPVLKETRYQVWRARYFDPCYEKHQGEALRPTSLFQKIGELHRGFSEEEIKQDPLIVRVRELQVFLEHHLEHESASYESAHRDALAKLDEVTEPLAKANLLPDRESAKRINEISHQFQITLADCIGVESTMLIGLPVGEVVDILDEEVLGRVC